MSKNKTKKVSQEEVPTSDETVDVIGEQKENNTPTFVVTRGGFRVSDREYNSPNDPYAVGEKDFWKRVIDRHPDGTKVEIVQFDKKKHRIW